MALASVTDDGDRLSLEQLQVGVFIVINFHFSSPMFFGLDAQNVT
jgi:hypothetical protein